MITLEFRQTHRTPSERILIEWIVNWVILIFFGIELNHSQLTKCISFRWAQSIHNSSFILSLEVSLLFQLYFTTLSLIKFSFEFTNICYEQLVCNFAPNEQNMQHLTVINTWMIWFCQKLQNFSSSRDEKKWNNWNGYVGLCVHFSDCFSRLNEQKSAHIRKKWLKSLTIKNPNSNLHHLCDWWYENAGNNIDNHTILLLFRGNCNWTYFF